MPTHRSRGDEEASAAGITSTGNERGGASAHMSPSTFWQDFRALTGREPSQ